MSVLARPFPSLPRSPLSLLLHFKPPLILFSPFNPFIFPSFLSKISFLLSLSLSHLSSLHNPSLLFFFSLSSPFTPFLPSLLSCLTLLLSPSLSPFFLYLRSFLILIFPLPSPTLLSSFTPSSPFPYFTSLPFPFPLLSLLSPKPPLKPLPSSSCLRYPLHSFPSLFFPQASFTFFPLTSPTLPFLSSFPYHLSLPFPSLPYPLPLPPLRPRPLTAFAASPDPVRPASSFPGEPGRR